MASLNLIMNSISLVPKFVVGLAVTVALYCAAAPAMAKGKGIPSSGLSSTQMAQLREQMPKSFDVVRTRCAAPQLGALGDEELETAQTLDELKKYERCMSHLRSQLDPEKVPERVAAMARNASPAQLRELEALGTELVQAAAVQMSMDVIRVLEEYRLVSHQAGLRKTLTTHFMALGAACPRPDISKMNPASEQEVIEMESQAEALESCLQRTSEALLKVDLGQLVEETFHKSSLSTKNMLKEHALRQRAQTLERFYGEAQAHKTVAKAVRESWMKRSSSPATIPVPAASDALQPAQGGTPGVPIAGDGAN